MEYSSRQLNAIRTLLLGNLYDKCNSEGIAEDELKTQLDQLQSEGCLQGCNVQDFQTICQLQPNTKGSLPACYTSADRQCVESAGDKQFTINEAGMKDWKRKYNVAKSQEFIPDIEDEEETEEQECVICKDSVLYEKDETTGEFRVVEGAVPIQESCGHYMHKECINKLEAAVCPMCRQVITSVPLARRLKLKFDKFVQVHYGNEPVRTSIYVWLNHTSNKPHEFNIYPTVEEVIQLFASDRLYLYKYNMTMSRGLAREIMNVVQSSLSSTQYDMFPSYSTKQRLEYLSRNLLAKAIPDIGVWIANPELYQVFQSTASIQQKITEASRLLMNNTVDMNIQNAYMLVHFMSTNKLRIPAWYPYIYQVVDSVPTVDDLLGPPDAANEENFTRYFLFVIAYTVVAAVMESIGQRLFNNDFDSKIPELYAKLKPFQVDFLYRYQSRKTQFLFNRWYQFFARVLMLLAMFKEYCAWMKVVMSVNPPTFYSSMIAGIIAEHMFDPLQRDKLVEYNQKIVDSSLLSFATLPSYSILTPDASRVAGQQIIVPGELFYPNYGIISSWGDQNNYTVVNVTTSAPATPVTPSVASSAQGTPSRFARRRPRDTDTTQQNPASKRRLF